MKFHYFPRTVIWLFCSTYVSAVHRMAQYPPFEKQAGLVDRQQLKCSQSTDTLCPTGGVCCPSGAACYTSSGVPLCDETCQVDAVTCFVNSILACCEPGQKCNPSGCISDNSGPGPTVTGSSGVTSSGPQPATTPNAPGAIATNSLGCGTNRPCYQGTSTWCCSPSLDCDLSSPGFCLSFSTSSPTVVTTSNIPQTTNVVVSLTTSHATGTGLAAPNVHTEGILMRIWACFAAMGIAFGF